MTAPDPASAPLVLTDVADGVATLVLNRPRQRNAIDMAMRQELLQAVHQMARDPQVQAVCFVHPGVGCVKQIRSWTHWLRRSFDLPGEA